MRYLITNARMGNNDSPFSNSGNGEMNSNQEPNGPPSWSGLRPRSRNAFPSLSTTSIFSRPTTWPQTTFQISSNSASPSGLGEIPNSSQTPSTLRPSTNASLTIAIILLTLLFLFLSLGVFFYRRAHHKHLQYATPNLPTPSPNLPVFELFKRSMSSNTNSRENLTLPLSLLDTKLLAPDPYLHPSFRSISSPLPTYQRPVSERSVSVYSDTNLYFITSKEIGLETRLQSRGGDLELKDDNTFLGAAAGAGSEGVVVMIGEGERRRPYRGKLRPGMGVQRLLTPNREVFGREML